MLRVQPKLDVHKIIMVITAILAVSIMLLFGMMTIKNAAAQTDKNKHYSDTLLEVKFIDESDIQKQGNKFVGTGADEVNEILGKAKVKGADSLFSENKASLKAKYAEFKAQGVADLSQYYVVRVAAEADVEAVAAQLEALEVVQDAYPQPLPVQPPVSPYWNTAQTHRHAAPAGVDTTAVATWPGAKGSKVEVIDVEYSWNVNHEDISKLRAPGAVINNGTPVDPFNSTDHGTAVAGILVADVNNFGVAGMVPDASLSVVNASNTLGYRPADAINVARTNMTAGDVMLIEQQTGGPSASTTDYVPLEWIASVYDAIKLATAAKIVVVEAAGNGNQNLNDTTQFGNPFPSSKASSGAIIVGASGACSSGTTPMASRMSFSTYGTRVDLQANGECVVTTGKGDMYSADGINAFYTHTFSGTSSASAIIAGTAAAFTSAYEQLNGVAPTPAYVLSSLKSGATAQNLATGTLTGNIGPKPNLVNAILKTDLTKPTVPQSFTATLDANMKPLLNWAASTDNVEVTGYKIFRNGVLVATVPPSTTWTHTAAPRGTAYYYIKAIDKSGNESAQTTSKYVTVP